MTKEPVPPLTLTAAQYKDPAARENRVWSLINSGKFDRGTAENLVEIERREAAGEPLLPQVASALARSRAALTELAEAQDAEHAALMLHSRRETLKAHREDLVKRIAGERQQIAECKHLLGDGRIHVIPHYESLKIHSQSWRDAAVGAGNFIAGAEAAAAFISEIVIPPLEKELHQAESELADFERQISEGIRSVSEPAA
jgi:hypothetical protein